MFLENCHIISEHIPKTGGTSLRKFFRDVFPSRQVYYYYKENGGLYSAKKDTNPVMHFPALALIQTKLLASKSGQQIFHLLKKILPKQKFEEDIPDPWAVIHGHKAIHEFYPKFPEAKLITVVREPLSRVISQYYYIRQRVIEGERPAEWVSGDEFKLPLEKFILTDSMQNFQSKIIAPRTIEDFYCIGITEKMDDFCCVFDPQGRFKPERLKKTIYPQYQLSDKLIAEFIEKNIQDYQLYEQAAKKWEVVS